MTSPILITARSAGTAVRVLISYDDCAKRPLGPALVRRLDSDRAAQALGAEIVVGDLHDRASLVRPWRASDRLLHVSGQRRDRTGRRELRRSRRRSEDGRESS